MNRELVRYVRLKNFACGVTLALASTITPQCSGQPNSAATPPPDAEKVFVANAGGDFGSYAHLPEGNDDRAYGVFFADMKKWGRYTLVPSPARADWVFQINVGNSSYCKEVTVKDDGPGSIPEQRKIVVNDNWVELVVMDVKMQTRRRFVEHLRGSLFSSPLFSSPEGALDRAVAALIDDFKAQLGESQEATHVEHLQTPPPIPPQIASAHAIFLSDISENDDEADRFSGGRTRLYQEMSRALQSWGRHELVDTPSHSELIVEVSFQVYRRCDWAHDHRLRLFLRDPRTGALLWGLTVHAGSPLLARNQRKAFDAGVAELVTQMSRAVEIPAWAADASIPARPQAVSSPTALRSATGLISATISTQKNIMKSGAELKVEVAVKNSLKQDLDFTYPEGDPLTCVIAVRDADGKMAPLTEQGRKLEDAHSTPRGRPLTYTLHPGEAQTRECVVSELYELSHAGKYFLEIQQLDGRPAESNILVLTVVP